MAETKKVTIGMGDFYITEYNEATGIPADTVLEVPENHLGHTKGGATIEYTPTVLDEKDDKGITRLLVITEEEAKITTGILTWNGSTLARLTENDVTEVAPVVEPPTAGKRTIKIGGRGACGITKHLIRFVHANCAGGNGLRVTMVVSNQAGFSLEFQRDASTVYDAEFTAHASDEDGTLIIIDEVIPVPVA